MKPKDVTSRARKGAAWSLVIGAAAFPLSYLRFILLGRVGGTPEVLASFKLLVLFLNAVSTFCFPGGRNIFPTYFPKLQSRNDRSRFVSGFLYVVLAAAALALIATTAWPGILDLILQQPVDRKTRIVLQALIPFALLSALANSVVMGNMAFVWGSLLLRIQLLCVTAVAAAMFFTDSALMTENAVFWLASAVAFAALVNMIVAAALLAPTLRLKLRPLFPAGCFKFTLITYLDTIMSYAYLAIDSYFVVLYFGRADLGIYVAMLETARVIPLAVQQLGHLMLTTFSKLLGTGAEDALADAYRRVSRLTVGVYAALSIPILFFSQSVAAVFGSGYADHHYLLIGLVVVVNIDSLKTINGMTLMAYERMAPVFVSKLLQNSVQLGVTLALIPRLGIYAVIVGKGVGNVVNAAALVIATASVRKLRPLRPPAVYLVSQLVVIAVAFLAYRTPDRGVAVSALCVAATWAGLWFVGGYRLDDIRAMIPWRKQTPPGPPVPRGDSGGSPR